MSGRPSDPIKLLCEYTDYGYVAQNAVVEKSRAERYARTCVQLALAALAPVTAASTNEVLANRFLVDTRWMPDDWQDWRAEFARDLRRMVTPASGVDEDAIEEVMHTLNSWSNAYPLAAFPEPEEADLKWLHATKPGLLDRISASMGRHMVKHMIQMRDSLTPSRDQGEGS